jgi:crotonobetainyl-CoA:carnitine CoA-transferase CaiB-like acyl-CoA transferase
MKVVAFVAFWAGPFAGSCLAALGADVIKIESIQRPDGMRFGGGVKLDHPQMYEFSAVTHGATAGLRSLTLDLERPEGRELALRLVAEADIVLDNFSPRVLDNHGLDETALRKARPDVVIARIPAFGLDGPWRDRGGFAMTVEQATGLAWRTGHADGQPLVPRGLCDVLGAYHLLLGVLAALGHRERTGDGLLVETPLVETALSIAAEQVIEWTANGALLGREGNRSFEWAPQGVYPCADDDRYVVISVATDDQWSALRRLIDDPQLDDRELDSLDGRRAHHDAIDAVITSWLRDQHVDDAVNLLLSTGVPAAPTLDARRLNHLPQLAARGWFETMEHPVAGTVHYLSLPMTFSAAPRPIYQRPAPTLGQHNDEVLRELGIDDAQIAALETEKIIGTKPVWL